MGIEAIDHLYIQTQDFDDSIAFWQALGYKKITEWNKYPTRGCRLEAGETFVVLAENTLNKPMINIHFRISDAERFLKEVSHSNVKIRIPDEKSHWGSRWMCVSDPDGNMFGLEETPPPRERGKQTVVFDVNEKDEPVNVRPI
jgi:predicted enzyme related to lactoylglutathione lyase